MTKEEFSFRVGKLIFLESLLGKLEEVEDARVYFGKSGTDSQGKNPQPVAGHNG
jgi:hypothetical protein